MTGAARPRQRSSCRRSYSVWAAGSQSACSRQTLARYWAHLLLLAVQERALHLCRPACQCCEVPSCAANARIDESDSQCRTFFIKRRGKRGVCALATRQAAIANAFGAVDQAAPLCEAARPRRDEGATPCIIIAFSGLHRALPESSLSSRPPNRQKVTSLGVTPLDTLKEGTESFLLLQGRGLTANGSPYSSDLRGARLEQGLCAAYVTSRVKT